MHPFIPGSQGSPFTLWHIPFSSCGQLQLPILSSPKPASYAGHMPFGCDRSHPEALVPPRPLDSWSHHECPRHLAGTRTLLPPNIRGLCIARLLVTEVTDYREGSPQNRFKIEWAIPARPDRWRGDDEQHEEVVAGGGLGPMQRMRELCSRLPARLPGSTAERCGFAIPGRMQRRRALRAGMPAGSHPDVVGADRRRGIARQTPHALGLQPIDPFDDDECRHSKPDFLRRSRCSQR